jgi:2-dehydropantoate 2-reductase
MLTRIGILGLGELVVILADYWRKPMPNQINSKLFLLAVKRKAIAESGLTIITDENEITVFPNIVSDDPLTIGSLIILFAQQNI